MNIIRWFQSTDKERTEFLHRSNEEGTTPLNRYEGDDRERYDVEDVPLTIYERGVTYQALRNEITYWEREMRDGNAQCPERISLLRNALQSLQQFDGLESWGEPLCEKDDEFEWVEDT